jgi:outer membrane protein TolC
MLAMRETMVARLNALLDRDAATSVGRVAMPRFPETPPSRAWLDSVAAQQRPMVRAGREELRAAEASETLARRELIPDLQVGIQYGQQRAVPGEMGGAGRDHMASLMVGASLPVFARSRQLQMRNEASAMRQMALADLANMRAETRGRIGEAFASLQRARRLETLYRTEIIPQAEATVASALSAYRVGSVDFMTLLDNQMSVNRYRQELATLEADQGKAWAELEMLTGRELFDPNTVALNEGGLNSPAPHPTYAPAPGGAR